MSYCIYTDKEVPETEGNMDHIVPLALGGDNGFCVWSDTARNSEIGTQVDGKLANDFLVMLARRNADARGHSRTPPIPVWKRTVLEGQPVQLRLGLDKFEAWDPRAKTTVHEEDIVGKTLESQLKIDRFASIRFAAKVALGGGYFVYGDAIRSAINCDELRWLVALDPVNANADPKLDQLGVQICDRFHGDANGGSVDGSMWRLLTEFTGRSVLICVPHDSAISFHVGVLGMFMASIICPAPSHDLPIEGDHDLGHVVLLGPGALERKSLRTFAGDAYKKMNSLPS